jgi:hypothetical protein
MAKAGTTQPETYTDENGLLRQRDPFGNGLDLVRGFDLESANWTILEEDAGEEVDWSTTPIVAGVLKMVKMTTIDHQDGRGEVPTYLYSLESAEDGRRLAVWGNYQLDATLKGVDSPYIGRMVYIAHTGKRDVKGGRSVNTYNIAVRND